MSWNDGKTIFSVVVNHEEQYSIWPDKQKLPPGWRAIGRTGTKSQCVAYIEKIGTDIRPSSLREQIEQMRKLAEAAGT